MSTDLMSVFDDALGVKVFGFPIDFPVGDTINAKRLFPDKRVTLVRVRSVKVAGHCTKVETLLVLPGDFRPVEDGEACHPEPGLFVWDVLSTDRLPRLTPDMVLASELVPSAAFAPMGFLPTGVIDGSFRVENVRQNGSFIEADVVAELRIAGVFTITITKHLRVNTGFPNPYYIDLGTVDLPVVGSVPVGAQVNWNLPGRRICVNLTVYGIKIGGEVCKTF